jgi:hypothetical protein
VGSVGGEGNIHKHIQRADNFIHSFGVEAERRRELENLDVNGKKY